MFPRLFSCLCSLVVLTGCVKLSVVGDYARESAHFASGTALASHYRDTGRREAPYLDPKVDPEDLANDQKRQAAYTEWIGIQKGLVDYMNALARLAGEDTQTAVIDTENLDTNLRPLAKAGVNSAHAEALASLANIVARSLRAGRQKRAIRAMVEAADPHIQNLAVAMADLVQRCQATHRNEQARVLNVLRFNLPYSAAAADEAPNPNARAAAILVNRLARAHLQAKAEEYDRAERLFVQASKGWAALAAGHHQLRQGLANRSGRDLLRALKPMADDLKNLKNHL